MFKHIGKVAAAVSIVLGSNAYCSDDAVKIFNPNPQKDDVVIPMPCDRVMVFKKVYTSNDPKKIKDKNYNAGSAQNKSPMAQNPNLRYVQGSLHDSKGYYFLMAKYELMAGQYDALVNSDKCDSLKLNKLSRLPAVKLSYFDAMNAAHSYSLFLQQAKGSFKSENNTVAYARLASDDEWEFAARGGNLSKNHVFPGVDGDPGSVAWYGMNSGNITHPVGRKKANELGLHDMAGNVWEWCSDWYEAYSAEPQTNPRGPRHGESRILRGGCLNSPSWGCTVSDRSWYQPDYGYGFHGFRLVLDSVEEPEEE